MRTLVRGLLGAVAGLVILVGGLVVATRGDHRVAALVTDDGTLPAREIAGVRLHMRIEEGPPDARTIVVLHGGAGGDFRSLLGLSALADTHTVVFYDQRGAGLSERVSADRLTLAGYLAELDAVIARASPDRPVILIGHSWGAMLASAYLGAHPDRVAGAVLIEPGYLDARGRAEWEARAAPYMSGPRYVVRAILTGFRALRLDGPDDHAGDDFLIGEMVGFFASHPDNPYHCGAGYTAPAWRFGSVASAAWRTAPDGESDLVARGTGYPGPVLFLAGGCNDWTGAPLQARHAARFRSAELRVIPDAGHDVVWDNPAATLDAIRWFLSAGGPVAAEAG